MIDSSTGSTPSSHHSMHQPHFKSHLYHRHNTKLSFVKLIDFSTPHAPASTSALYGSTNGKLPTSAFLHRKRRNLKPRIIKEPRKRKRRSRSSSPNCMSHPFKAARYLIFILQISKERKRRTRNTGPLQQ
jgi:hypothetical protein